MPKCNVKYGPFVDVACVVHMIGPMPWKRTYTTKKLFEQFTDKYCQPDITDPMIRAKVYTSMLMEQRLGDSIYGANVEVFTKCDQSSCDFEDGTVGEGVEFSTRYKNYTTSVICLNTTKHPEEIEPVKSYLNLVKADTWISSRISRLMDEMKTLLAEDKEEGGNDAEES